MSWDRWEAEVRDTSGFGMVIISKTEPHMKNNRGVITVIHSEGASHFIIRNTLSVTITHKE